MKYIYSFSHTQGTTGYADFLPNPSPALTDGIALLQERPNDIFLFRYLLNSLIKLSGVELAGLFANACIKIHPVIIALLAEAEKYNPGINILLSKLGIGDADISTGGDNLSEARDKSPGVVQKEELKRLFRNNIHGHRPINYEVFHNHDKLDYDMADNLARISINSENILKSRAAVSANSLSVLPQNEHEIYQLACEILKSAGILAGVEMRHEASLSPIALLRNWNIRGCVQLGRNRHEIGGIATAYGRGLSLKQARLSCIMEIMERASAYAEVFDNGAFGRVGKQDLIYASWLELQEQNILAVYPDSIGAKPGAQEVKLHWLSGIDAHNEPVLVPAQAVYLFCNLDEDQIFEHIGSTGLASGSTLEMAKLAALLEVMERYAHATTPFFKQDCFELTARDPVIKGLLGDYRWRGIKVQFQDITTELGIPAYRCFVSSKAGDYIAQAACAKFSGADAALGALTETPWPYIWANPVPAPSGSGLSDLPIRVLEDLPDYRGENHAFNLATLEAVLEEAGYTPVYINISKPDLQFPVCRVLVPGLDIDPEFGTSLPSRLVALALKGRQ